MPGRNMKKKTKDKRIPRPGQAAEPLPDGGFF